MAKEVVVGDIHDDLRVFKSLDTILANEKDVKKVFLVGDISDGFNDKDLEAKMRDVQKDPAKKKILHEQMMIAGALQEKQEEQEEITDEEIQAYQAVSALAQGIYQDLLGKEAEARYKKLNDAAVKVGKKHKLPINAVAGNHDDVMIYKNMPGVKFLDQQPHLAEERIIGARRSTEGTHQHQKTQGTMQLPADDHTVLEVSPVYTRYAPLPIDLIVTHKSSMLGELAKKDMMPTGNGLPALATKNRCVEYCGHFHQGWVYRDPKTGVLSINPGTKHMMVVSRDGKKVDRIRIYALGYDAAA